MADIKISQLGEALAVTDNDILPMTASGVTSKVKASTMKSYMVDDIDVSDLHDTTITTPTDDDGLVYNGTSQKWENKQITTKEQWKETGAYNICPNNATSQVVNQITYIVNSNKTITATWSSTPSGNSPLLIAARGLLKLKAGTTYKLVGCPTGGGWSAGNFKYRVFIQDNTAVTDIQDTGDGVIFTPTEEHEYTVYISIAQHAGASGNLIFKPMVTTDLNATYDDYVEYAKTNQELTENVTPIRRTVSNFPTSTGSSYSLYKVGKIGVLQIVAALTNVVADTWTLIGTIEAGARPITAYFFACVNAGTNNAVQGLIETDGSVKINSHTAGTMNIRASITYIIA